MDTCIFCNIVTRKLGSACFWEDSEFMAILDINPNTPGMALVITKNHYNSYAFDMPNDVYQRFMLAAKKVAGILECGLGVQRVALVMEGMGVDHAHIKLYPLHGLDKKFTEMNAPTRVFFDQYPGYLTTQMGPQVNFEDLDQMAEKLKNTCL